MHFRVVDGRYETEEEYERFKDYYLNKPNISIERVCELLGINKHTAYRLGRRVSEETGLTRSKGANGCILPYNPVKPTHCRGKYYYRYHNRFIVKKRIDGEWVIFGSYDNELDAKRVVEYLRCNDWCSDGLTSFMKECGIYG